MWFTLSNLFLLQTVLLALPLVLPLSVFVSLMSFYNSTTANLLMILLLTRLCILASKPSKELSSTQLDPIPLPQIHTTKLELQETITKLKEQEQLWLAWENLLRKFTVGQERWEKLMEYYVLCISKTKQYQQQRENAIFSRITQQI